MHTAQNNDDPQRSPGYRRRRPTAATTPLRTYSPANAIDHNSKYKRATITGASLQGCQRDAQRQNHCACAKRLKGHKSVLVWDSYVSTTIPGNAGMVFGLVQEMLCCCGCGAAQRRVESGMCGKEGTIEKYVYPICECLYVCVLALGSAWRVLESYVIG